MDTVEYEIGDKIYSVTWLQARNLEGGADVKKLTEADIRVVKENALAVRDAGTPPPPVEVNEETAARHGPVSSAG